MQQKIESPFQPKLVPARLLPEEAVSRCWNNMKWDWIPASAGMTGKELPSYGSSLALHSNKAQHASGLHPSPSVGRKPILTVCTDIQEVDVTLSHSQIDELGYIRLPQIKDMFIFSVWMRLKRIEGQSFDLKIPENLLPDLITFFSNARPHAHEQGGNGTAVVILQAFDNLLNDSLMRSSPAAMAGSNHSLFLIHDENRKTVRRLYKEKQKSLGSDQGIPAEIAVRIFVYEVNDIGMDLFESDQPKIPPSWILLKVVFSPVNGPESMDEERDFFQPGDGQVRSWHRGFHRVSDCIPITMKLEDKKGRTVLFFS
jgi:hypothetical protein